MSRRTGQQGFTYIGLLAAVVIMGLLLTIVGRIWSTTEQREREAELLFIGHSYRMGIASYYAAGHQYPPSLESLLTDERFPVPKHHLRRLYPDPLTGGAEWTLIMNPSGTGIMGIASSSQGSPIKRDGFDEIDRSFQGADCYCQWQFIYYASRWNRRIAPLTAPDATPSATSGSGQSDTPDGSESGGVNSRPTPDPAQPLNAPFQPGHLTPSPPARSFIPNGGLDPSTFTTPAVSGPATN
jgi:type II secretory pathway pseudopilin PulG